MIAVLNLQRFVRANSPACVEMIGDNFSRRLVVFKNYAANPVAMSYRVRIIKVWNLSNGYFMNDKTINTNNYVAGNVTGGNIAGRDIIINNPPIQPSEPLKVDLYHLPKPTTALIGRKTELTQLTEAIKNPNKRLAIIVAAGLIEPNTSP